MDSAEYEVEVWDKYVVSSADEKGLIRLNLVGGKGSGCFDGDRGGGVGERLVACDDVSLLEDRDVFESVLE